MDVLTPTRELLSAAVTAPMGRGALACGCGCACFQKVPLKREGGEDFSVCTCVKLVVACVCSIT